MSKRTKMILSVIGIGAVVIPAALLIFFTTKETEEPQVPTGVRQIDTSVIERAIEKIEPKEPEFPSPSPATVSAEENEQGDVDSVPEGSPSAQ